MYRALKTLIIYSLLGAGAAQAADPYAFSGTYTLSFASLRIGECTLQSSADQSTYKISALVRTSDLGNIFAKHESQTTASGTVGSNLGTGAHRFETFYKLRGKAKHIKVSYDTKGNVTEALIEPPETKDKRPPVPAEQSAGSLDILSFIPQARMELAKGTSSFDLPVFDGRRLMRAHAELAGKRTIVMNQKQVPVVTVKLTRSAIAGFNAKELKALRKEPVVTVDFSDDGAWVPLHVQSYAALGVMEATLQQ